MQEWKLPCFAERRTEMLRSLLFLPGNNPNMLINADCLGADGVIFDLEDAVSPEEKDAARILVRNTLKFMDFKGLKTVVRINSVDTDFWKKDVETILPFKPDFILLPKTSGVSDIFALEGFMSDVEKELSLENESTKIIALIETALGVENAFSIAASSKRVKALFLGAEDLTADLGCERTKEGKEIEYSRGRLVVAAKAAGVDVYDTPFTDVNDDEGAIADAETAKGFGFTGKASISPRHVEIINNVFSPKPEEIDYAYQVIETIELAKQQGKGAVSLRGKMIDAPIVERAKKTIALAEALGISRRSF